MMRSGKYILPGLLLLLSSFAYRTAQDDCVALIKEIFGKVSIRDLPEGNQVYYFDYTIRTTLSDKKVQPSSSHVKVYVSRDHVQIHSDQMEVYQDAKNAFTVIPMRKLIYWADSQLGKKDTAAVSGKDNIALIKDKVFDNSTVKVCRLTEGSPEYNKEVILIPDKQVSESLKINNVRFLVNEKKRTLHKTFINYGAGSNYSTVEVTYHQIDYDHKKLNLNYSSKSKIYKSDGSLLPEYAGYKVVDVRGNKN